MERDIQKQYVASARFDYIKLRWHYAGEGLVEHVRELVDAEFIKLQASAPNVALKDPKYTIIPASPSKPDGIFIVELFGFAAEVVRGLPAGWLANVTYAHVKAFAEGMTYADITTLQRIYMSRSARRSATLIRGGTAGRSQKGTQMPAIRIGSRKSDWHGVIYARRGFAPGFEGRFRDEGVAQRTLAALDYWNNGEVHDRMAWSHFLRSLARATISYFETDAAQRYFQLEDFLDGFSSWHRVPDDQLALGVEADDVIEPPSFDGSDYASDA